MVTLYNEYCIPLVIVDKKVARRNVRKRLARKPEAEMHHTEYLYVGGKIIFKKDLLEWYGLEPTDLIIVP
jgi:hypothetical protein